jgi:2-C-methyl-D-erythritol 2,4-cyclodiphosphate synthase
LRTGIGVDAHRFSSGRKLVLGGVEIEHDRGLEGHSDADVLVHAVMDALLGACGAGDIGRMFPDDDPQYSGASSITLLERVHDEVRRLGFAVLNVDAVVVCEEPRIAPYVESMRTRVASALHVAEDAVSVKGTTTEGMGFAGRREGIAAVATVLVDRT